MSSEVRLIENWREKWEPVDKYGGQVVYVNPRPNGIYEYAYVRKSDGQMFLSVHSDNSLRLIPKPQPTKLRPWRREEVPVGSVVRHIETGSIALITGASDDCAINNYAMSFWRVFNEYVRHDLHPDGTWKPTEQCRPCGVEE